MKEEHLLMYALVFVLGFVVARMMSGRLVEGYEGEVYSWDEIDCSKQGNGDWYCKNNMCGSEFNCRCNFSTGKCQSGYHLP